ncbi:MAG: RNase adapter RapZ [Alphaproteobacteria bacterium]|nr:RNase adapter RapZ [Alphaproteobacteria bacterium]
MSKMPRRIVLLTGMSGAGLNTAMKAFEDMGYESVSNIRLSLIPALFEATKDSPAVALCIDSHTVGFSVDGLLSLYGSLAQNIAVAVRLVFLECEKVVLQERFTATRRRHPQAIDRPLPDGIRAEREMMRHLRDAADQVIDTSRLSAHDLRRILVGNYALENRGGLSVFVTSFSYRRGLPREADFVVDTRFLSNPYWQEELRHLTGQDPAVQSYIEEDPSFQPFMDNLTALLIPLLPCYQFEGKSYFTLAIGCTGGQHRSVAVAEKLVVKLRESGYEAALAHRDLERALRSDKEA